MLFKGQYNTLYKQTEVQLNIAYIRQLKICMTIHAQPMYLCVTHYHITVYLLYILTFDYNCRRPKADDRVRFQSPDDAITFDGFENPISKDPGGKHIIVIMIL